ncbi:hypothetical protein NHX12_024003 [Muraenolepis orangiensis]|uniref:Heat shock factor-binding protein 1-like n=1 Tax=Muraenolepis orangiensis TaxID=630683 RepID=A0A9Q0ES14_9TELE|nr:hypothetical protein NHX12_024003 [Muraenolepis orangiensis]
MSNTTEPKTPKDMIQTMEQTMERLQGRFQAMSEQLQTKLDQMGTRIEGLEKNVTDLMGQAGMDEKPFPKGPDGRTLLKPPDNTHLT